MGHRMNEKKIAKERVDKTKKMDPIMHKQNIGLQDSMVDPMKQGVLGGG